MSTAAVTTRPAWYGSPVVRRLHGLPALPDVAADIAAAEAEALAAHQAGTCADSEWSCSYREEDAR